jgi:hypothetical protein
MAGGTATGGAADTAGTAADGTVIIDSELGHGARRRSPQRGTFVRRWLPVNDAASYIERLRDALFLRQLVKCGEATCACRLHFIRSAMQLGSDFAFYSFSKRSIFAFK